MSGSLGSVCIVLHGHLPYVLRHGVWPHGEDWLYEAAAETYLPVLSTIDECRYFNARAHLTIGLTPVLLEQLADDHFKDGFEHYLRDRADRARADQRDFERHGDLHLAYLATRWQQWYTKLGEQFSELQRDIPRAFADRAREGLIELLTSNATHGYMPLLLEDSSIRAQLRAGLATSHRILGFKPTGMWLPECAYRPQGHWTPPAVFDNQRFRVGIENLVADEGIDHFFVEHHLVKSSRSEWVRNHGHWHKVDWDEATKYPARGWRSVNEPHLVSSDGTSGARCAAIARDPQVCEQVWSGSIGYPAHGSYLEFHRKWGERRGLRYWKITGKGVDLGAKERYYPDDVPAVLHEHAQHFVNFTKQRLAEHRARTGRPGMVAACFDAELFGHWWFEGPRFLRDVILSINADPDINLSTTADYLKRSPADKIVSMPEGSWGDGGDHRVWLNDQTRWIWEVEYRAEALFGRHTYHLPWRDPDPKHQPLRELLQLAGRELLLMQASDWPFVIARGQAIDYGVKRFVLHAGRFENLCDMAEKVVRGEPLTDLERFEVQDAQLHDPIFRHVDLNWWNM